MAKNNNRSVSNDDSCSSYSNDSSCSDAEAFLFREIIRPPVPGDGASYKVCMDKPNFNIVNNYFSPISGHYTFHLPNSVSLFAGDAVNIKLRIPRQMLKCKYGFEIPMDSGATTYFNNLMGVFKLNAANEIDTKVLTVINNNGCYISVNNQSPGWIEFLLTYMTQNNDEYIDICSIAYSISFDSIKLKSLYGSCCKEKKCKHKCRKPNDVIKLEADTVFEIVTAVEI